MPTILKTGSYGAAPSTALTIKLEARDGRPVANSKNVAAMFDKRHGDVLNSIKGLEIDENLRQSFFIPNTTPDHYGRPQTTYDMTRDGFTLLAMGFTGGKALAFKLAYIKAFNEMEAALRGPAQAVNLNDPATLRPKIETLVFRKNFWGRGRRLRPSQKVRRGVCIAGMR